MDEYFLLLSLPSGPHRALSARVSVIGLTGDGDPGAMERVLRTEGGSLVTEVLDQVQTLFLLFSYPVIPHLHLQNTVNIVVAPLSPVGMAAAAVLRHTCISAFFPL